MEFKEFKEIIQRHFAEMTKDADHLFEVEVDKDRLWNLYLDSFPKGTNKVYRKRREFDCSCCRQFIRAIGNAVVIKDNVVHTIWEVQTEDSMYQPVADALNAFILSSPVSDIYVCKTPAIGTDKTHESEDNGTVKTWEHFYLSIPSKLVDRSSLSEGDIKGKYRDTKNVFKRSLDEITDDSVDTVLELIFQNSLYKGLEWKTVLEEFKKYKDQYKSVPEALRNNFAWEKSIEAGMTVGRIRNHSMGTLLVDISEGMPLDQAVQKYEAIVAPTNYKRPKAIFTKKMLEEAKKTLSDLGYMDSLERRYATLDDITVNNILFSNRDAAKRISGDVFSSMESEVAVDPKKFSKVQEITAADFVKSVLPTAKTVEVFLEGKHAPNMVSLIAPGKKDAPSMFKWNNGFSWAYSGNITDSNVKENVKSAGGKVDGVLRFSIQWNDEDYNPNDFDAHCVTPNGTSIYFNSKYDPQTGGSLDVDIIDPQRNKAAVENITWPSMDKMCPGKYQFFVHCFNNNGGRSGFKAEIEFNGEIHSYEYNKSLRQSEKVYVAEVNYHKEGGFSIKDLLPSNVSSKNVWGLMTNQFVPVSVVMYSPNYWDEQDGIGNRHYFFMLNGCVNNESPNGFYNEFLKPDLEKHKRVFEALGGKMAVADSQDQLSGLGFSSTKRNELVVKVTGATSRILKIKF
jgi:hypothetical protein